MKLESKHLAAYLSYNVPCLYACIMDADNDTTIPMNETNIHRVLNGYGSFVIKPILRPLSDFKGMIIIDIRLFLELSHNQTMEFLGFSDGEIQLQNISLGLHDAMCQKHVDFNKLIEKGLAIDINTI